MENTKEKYFEVKFGEFGKTAPDVLSITIKAKVKPVDRKTNYSKDVKKIKTEFEESLKTIFSDNEFFSRDFLFTISMSENNITYGKASNVKCEILLKKKTRVENKNIEEASNEITTNISSIMNENHFYVV